MKLKLPQHIIDLNPHLSPSEIASASVAALDKTDNRRFEQMLVQQCVDAGIDPPLTGVPFAKSLRLGFLADSGWANPRIIAEVNGSIWRKGGHNTGAGLQRDYFKQNIATLLGFMYFEFSPQMVEDGTALTVLLCAHGKIELHEQDWKSIWEVYRPKPKPRGQAKTKRKVVKKRKK